MVLKELNRCDYLIPDVYVVFERLMGFKHAEMFYNTKLQKVFEHSIQASGTYSPYVGKACERREGCGSAGDSKIKASSKCFASSHQP